MDITYIKPTPEEYVELRINSNMGGGAKKLSNAETALNNSLFTVSIRDNNKLIGFGRIVGDGAISFIVNDIMVHKNYQKQGIGTIIMAEINSYFEKYTDNDAYITLTAVKPAHKLYEKFNFVSAEPKSMGMIRQK